MQPSDLDFDAADGCGTISVSKTMQRANKDAPEKLDPKQVYYTFPDRREGSKPSLILKKPKTKKSNRILYMTKPLKEELLAWLEKLKQDEQYAPEKYSNFGQLFRLPDGLPIAPELLTKWYRLWRAEHPEFEQIVFHGLLYAKENRLYKPCAEKPLIRANVQTVCRKCAAAFLHKERTSNLTI